MTPTELADMLIEVREKASRYYDTEDFNESLSIDGVTGSFGFEMLKCDRDFIAFAANNITTLATSCLRLIEENARLRDEAAFIQEYLNPKDTSFKTMVDSFKLLSKEKQGKLIDLSRSLLAMKGGDE